MARVFSINEDNNGRLWIGTADNDLWRYEEEHSSGGELIGKGKLTHYTMKDGLTSNSIQAIYKDQKGELWFGTVAGGVNKFNGKTFSKFTVNRNN